MANFQVDWQGDTTNRKNEKVGLDRGVWAIAAIELKLGWQEANFIMWNDLHFVRRRCYFVYYYDVDVWRQSIVLTGFASNELP